MSVLWVFDIVMFPRSISNTIIHKYSIRYRCFSNHYHDLWRHFGRYIQHTRTPSYSLIRRSSIHPDLRVMGLRRSLTSPSEEVLACARGRNMRDSSCMFHTQSGDGVQNKEGDPGREDHLQSIVGPCQRSSNSSSNPWLSRLVVACAQYRFLGQCVDDSWWILTEESLERSEWCCK